MVDVSKSTIIPELHDLGKELRLLQHLFESYKILIQTILAPPDVDDSERVRPDLQARDRFRRLGDRLQLLMLNTIKEYLDEKKELSSTVSNPPLPRYILQHGPEGRGKRDANGNQ